MSTISTDASPKGQPEITITRAEADTWMGLIKHELVDGDLDTLMTLFAPDVRFRFSAFDQEFSGRDTLRKLASEQILSHLQDIDITFDIWGVKANELMAFWRSRYFWTPSNEFVEMDGVVCIAFSGRENGVLRAGRFVRWFDQERS